ncbi:MAG: YggS family pyridoxal phosphate enzyme, partial [Puniceicoccales bacterium]|nr:YggS family pyridoxal phosphate enzyme [Puniceicoccales bacterium]
MISYEEFAANCQDVLERIEQACLACGRKKDSVVLLPVTKTHLYLAVEYAHRYGFLAIGENRVQEAVEKKGQTPAKVRWELIGHLQSNKAKQAVATFDRIQSLDSPELALRIDRLAGESGKVMPVLLQANAGGDPAKFGAADFDGLLKLADVAMGAPNLQVEGLMTIPALDADLEVARMAFETLRNWREKLESRFGRKL